MITFLCSWSLRRLRRFYLTAPTRPHRCSEKGISLFSELFHCNHHGRRLFIRREFLPGASRGAPCQDFVQFGLRVTVAMLFRELHTSNKPSASILNVGTSRPANFSKPSSTASLACNTSSSWDPMAWSTSEPPAFPIRSDFASCEHDGRDGPRWTGRKSALSCWMVNAVHTSL